MNLHKSDYGTVIKFGSLIDLNNKLQLEKQGICDVINQTDNNGISLLEKALISGKFDIAEFFLNQGAKVNVISKDGLNELHYLAANVNSESAIEIASY